ncbi:cytochrome P450-like protein 20 [Leptotrombidium deliense]|uniref:Cytochrome P450-like protein 20 n=1 Tax=Leptotrombidium deliense TaxID=299467 RepID=A0A443SFZ6_9ACAR|nr:cytochrome P450-like protein 20 [Leptotrombidium deliense]
MHSEFCDLLLSFTRLALIFFIILFVLRFWCRTHTFLPLPPGPFSIPLLGFLPFVGKDFHLTLTELAKSYGSVYQIFLGSRRVVIINDFRLVREAFRKPIFSGRPDTEVTKILQGYGIVHSDGDLWNEQRTFLHKVLRQIGVKQIMQNNNAIEHKINIQVKEFLNSLETFERKSCRIRPFIACAVSNVIGSLLISLTLKNEEDENFRKLLELIDEGFKHVTVAMPVNFIPILRYIPIVNSAVQKIKQNREQTGEYFKNLVENHRKTLDPSNLRDICDAYLVQQEKVQNNGKKSYFSEEQLIQIMNDMFSAGMETVTSTLEWAILFLMLNPEAQKNIQKEIDNIVGNDRLPTLADMANMPYTEATIYEVLRRSNVIALGIAHLTLQ